MAEGGNVVLLCKEVSCYITESKPTGRTNLAFPDECRALIHIIESKIDPESSTAKFLNDEPAYHHNQWHQNRLKERAVAEKRR